MDSKFEVAISGISGKFPECEDVPSFKDALYQEKPLLSMKDERWPINYTYKYSNQILPKATGKVRAIKDMDIGVFKINNAIAECTSVSNRGVLQPAFEAVMDAGVNPHDLSGRCIAVYAAAHHCDTDQNAATLGEGRLWMVGSGPSETIYHDMNGSFLALNEAYKMISEGHAEAAIVGIVSAALFPSFSLNLASMNLLSTDAVTRVFDKNANGYGRSDAFVALYLQRAEEAKRIYGIIDFSGYTYYGSNPNSLLGYEENMIKQSLLDMYSEKDYKGYKDVAFVEMNACGSKRNDKIECNVIADVLCEGKKTPLLVGSVKSNTGNTEGAAPYVGLCKAIFALETGSLLHNINLQQIDDDIEALAENKLKVVTKPTQLPSDKIAINSVGFAGSLSQIVVKRNPKSKTPSKDNLARLALICGRTEDGTRNAIAKLERKTFDTNFISLINDVFGTDMPFHTFRGYTILSSDPTRSKKNALDVKGNKSRPVWFLFSGMGSQWNLMGNGLLNLPIFAETVRKCHDVLKPKGVDIYHILTTDDPTIFDNIVHAFVGIITIQIALVEILKALGIKADGIIGHSVGENACAYADGCLTLEQAVLASYARGLASIETETIRGMMAAIGKGYHQIKDSLPPNIEVACHNSASSCTLSGPADDVHKFVHQLQEEKVFARAVNVANIAYHSKYIAPAAPNLLARLKEVIPSPIKRSPKWVSTSVPESNWDQPLAKYCSAEYLTNNLLSSVLFEEGCKHIPSDALVIEIAPHGLLQAILKRSLPDTCTNVSLTRRNQEDKNFDNLLTGIGELYISGCNVNVNAIYPPTCYPVPRDTPSVAPFAVWHQTSPDAGVFRFDSIGSSPSDPITIHVNGDSPYFYLQYHRINNRIILPTSFFLYLTWWVYSIQHKQEFGKKPIVFSNIHLFKNITTSLTKPRTFTVYIQKGSGTFEILKLSETDKYKTTKVITGVIVPAKEDSKLKVNESKIFAKKYTVTGEEFYNYFNDVGYQLKGSFRAIQHLTYNETDSYANIEWNNNWVSVLDAMLKFSMFNQMRSKADLMYTKKIRKLEISPSQIQSVDKGGTLLCYQNFMTNEITSNGIFIYGIQNDSFTDIRGQDDIKLEGLKFISHQNPKCQSVTEFLNVCVQVAYDITATMTKQNNPKLNVVVENNENIAKFLKAIVKSNPSLKSKLVFWKPKELLSDEHFKADNCFLIVTENFDDIRKYIPGSLLLMIRNSNDQAVIQSELEKSFVEITKQGFNESSISLHRRKSPNDGFESQQMLMSDDDWDTRYTRGIDKSQTKFIAKKNTNYENLSLMLTNEKRSTDHQYLFIMDEAMPNDTTLKMQFTQNLPVTVLQNGEWGSYRTVLKEFPQKNRKTKRTVYDLSLDIQLESIFIRYLNPDPKIEMEDKTCYGIEYSGVHFSNEKIMGLSLIDTLEPINEPDTILMWKVPNTWSLEDAATVPLAYVNAYNIMKTVFETPFSKQYKVLIIAGNAGLLALACISLSLQKNYAVYVVVSNDQEADNIQRKFPQIVSSQILNRQFCNYEIEILTATKGLGVDVVINCLSGIEHINAMFRCAAEFSLCFAVTLDNVELQQIGLRPFARSVSFYTVPTKISALLKLPESDKKKLHDYVQKGIESGIVKPFERDVHIYGLPAYFNESGERNFIKTVYRLTPQNVLGHSIDQKIRYDNNHSYIIVGGEKKDTSWFELTEWLITKGARKFIITVDNFFVGPKISHKMNRLLNQKKAAIILTSSQRVESIKDATELVEEANNVAPLEAIFFISVMSASEKIRNMDMATQPNHSHVYFVSIFSGGLTECESRRYKGSPALVIHGKKQTNKLSVVFPFIDDVLQKFDNSNSPTLYRMIEQGSEMGNSFIQNYIPSDMFVLEQIGSNPAKDAEFVEVTTLTPRFAEVKNMTPVFIISALGPKPLQGLIANLICPAFCAVITKPLDSIIEAASKLYESLNRIQSKEGVTLIAETWWSSVAIEITRLLEHDGRKYRLFTIEGNPLVWKERIQTLGPIDSPQFENNLIVQVFKNYAKTPIVHANCNSSQSLADKISAFLPVQSYQSPDAHHLANAIAIIRNGLTLSSKYNHNTNEIVKNTIALLQRTPSDDKMMNLSVTSEIFMHSEENYYKFINSKIILRKINDNILHNIWFSKEHRI